MRRVHLPAQPQVTVEQIVFVNSLQTVVPFDDVPEVMLSAL